MSNRLPDGTEALVSQYRGELSNDFVLGGPAQDPWYDNSDVLMQMFGGYEGYARKQAPTMNGLPGTRTARPFSPASPPATVSPQRSGRSLWRQ